VNINLQHRELSKAHLSGSNRKLAWPKQLLKTSATRLKRQGSEDNSNFPVLELVSNEDAAVQTVLNVSFLFDTHKISNLLLSTDLLLGRFQLVHNAVIARLL